MPSKTYCHLLVIYWYKASLVASRSMCLRIIFFEFITENTSLKRGNDLEVCFSLMKTNRKSRGWNPPLECQIRLPVVHWYSEDFTGCVRELLVFQDNLFEFITEGTSFKKRRWKLRWNSSFECPVRLTVIYRSSTCIRLHWMHQGAWVWV